MNNIFKNIILGTALAVGLTSCGDFFEESSQDEIKPTTIEDLSAVLNSTAYPYLVAGTDSYLILLTDEVQCNGVKHDNYKDRHHIGEPIFCFDNEMSDGYKSFIDDENSWKNWYKLIMGCNVVLDNVDNMIGSDLDKRHVKGQAQLLRAYYYLRLAMVYAQPYCKSPEQNLGVSILTSSHVSDTEPSRSTVKQTYDFIESELIASSELLKDFTPTTCYRVSSVVADILLARLYLYEEKWDKAIELATKAIKEGPNLTDLNNLPTTAKICNPSASTEVVWNYEGRVAYSTYIGSNSMYSGMLPYTLDTKVTNLYDQTNDLRYKNYISASTYYGNYVMKSSTSFSRDGEHVVRMTEAYITRAEAYAHKNDKPKAISDLNEIRKNRYKMGTYVELTDGDVSDVMQAVLDERQREFVWEEGLRWMDIKRLDIPVTHTFIDEEGNSNTFTLNEKMYALPIPSDAITRNKNLIQNPR